MLCWLVTLVNCGLIQLVLLLGLPSTKDTFVRRDSNTKTLDFIGFYFFITQHMLPKLLMTQCLTLFMLLSSRTKKKKNIIYIGMSVAYFAVYERFEFMHLDPHIFSTYPCKKTM